jgi:hypothetical protein
MEARAPLVYYILGTPGSGRRGIVADLVANGLAATDSAALLLPEGASVAGATIPVAKWSWNERAIEAAVPAGASHVFMFADPGIDPVDQLEALVAWLPAVGAKIGRVFTVVDCTFGQAHPDLFGWFEACVHFSDVVFFTNRSGVPGSWISDFEKHFRKLFYPCLFEKPVDGEVSNPALVLEAQALRMSPAFEDDFELAGAEIEFEVEDEDEGDDDLVEEEPPPEDLYFARNRGGGNRVIKVPDIAPFITSLD